MPTNPTDHYHTHDEELREVDFHRPIVPLGAKALEVMVTQPEESALIETHRDEPHEHYGFGD